MNTSQEGIDLIKSFEACKLEAYQDGGGVWTIGWGHTGGVSEGDTCTQEQADAWLVDDLGDAEGLVKHFVTVDLNQHQFDALVAFTFNVGGGALQHSTLLQKLNAGDYEGAADEFPRWSHIGAVVCQGLLRRRVAEKQEFEEAEDAAEQTTFQKK